MVVKSSDSADGELNLSVQLIYAEPDCVWRRIRLVLAGTTIRQLIQASGFLDAFPSYPLDALVVGVYGQVCGLDHVLTEGDRVEVYRPLIFDPMESRRRRALHRKAFMIKPRNRPKRRKAKLAAARALSDYDKEGA